MLGDELGPPGIATPVSANRTQIAASRRVPPFGPDGRKRTTAVSHTDGILPRQARARSTVSREAGFLECLVKELRFAFLPDDSPGVGTGGVIVDSGDPLRHEAIVPDPNTAPRTAQRHQLVLVLSLFSGGEDDRRTRQESCAKRGVHATIVSVARFRPPHRRSSNLT
jgi:hypothetical protein